MLSWHFHYLDQFLYDLLRKKEEKVVRVTRRNASYANTSEFHAKTIQKIIFESTQCRVVGALNFILHKRASIVVPLIHAPFRPFKYKIWKKKQRRKWHCYATEISIHYHVTDVWIAILFVKYWRDSLYWLPETRIVYSSSESIDTRSEIIVSLLWT